MLLPCAIGDYTDFYASIHHATNVGSMFRPDNPLLPNYKYVPIGYHGRASSIVVSGTPFASADGPDARRRDRSRRCSVRRGASTTSWRSARIIGRGNALGEPVPIDRRRSAHLRALPRQRLVGARHPDVGVPAARTVPREELRDVDLAVGRDARRARAVPRRRRRARRKAIRRRCRISSPTAIARSTSRSRCGSAPTKMREPMLRQPRQLPRHVLDVRAARRASHVERLQPAAGRPARQRHGVSGTTKESRGCLLELTWRGTEPLELPNGETRTFLEDGDEVILRALLRARRSADRIRRVPRHRACRP